jgi:hypothetical protein
MLDTWRHGRAPAVALRRISDGDVLIRRGVDEPDVPERVGAQKPLEASRDHQEISRFGAGHRFREHRDGHGGSDLQIFARATDDDIGGHRMPQQCHAAIDAGQGQDRIRHAADLTLQERGGSIDACNITRHPRWIAAMPFEIEGDGDVASLRECQRIGFHQLSGAGKAVADDHGGSLRTTGPSIDGRRGRANVERHDRQARTCALEMPDSGQAQQQTH